MIRAFIFWAYNKKHAWYASLSNIKLSIFGLQCVFGNVCFCLGFYQHKYHWYHWKMQRTDFYLGISLQNHTIKCNNTGDMPIDISLYV